MTKPTIKSQLECRELKDTSAGSNRTKTETWRECILPFFNTVLELSPGRLVLTKVILTLFVIFVHIKFVSLSFKSNPDYLYKITDISAMLQHITVHATTTEWIFSRTWNTQQTFTFNGGPLKESITQFNPTSVKAKKTFIFGLWMQIPHCTEKNI